MIVTLLGALLLAVAPPPPQNYAVLVASHAQQVEDVQQGDADFRNDLLAQYSMLCQLGFSENQILVFYGIGGCARLRQVKVPGCPGKDSLKCDDATPYNIEKALSGIGKSALPPAYLYMWWMSHGKQDDPDDCMTMRLVLEGGGNNEPAVASNELGYWLASTNAAKIDLFIAACFGEGAIKYLDPQANANVVAIADSQCGKLSSDVGVDDSCDCLPHDELNYMQRAAVLADKRCEGDWAPTLVNNRLSLQAIMDYATHMRYSQPAMVDLRQNASQSYLDLQGRLGMQTPPCDGLGPIHPRFWPR